MTSFGKRVGTKLGTAELATGSVVRHGDQGIAGTPGEPADLLHFFLFERASSSPSRLFENCTRDDQTGSCVALPTPGEMKILEEILLNLKDAMRFWATGPSHFIDMRENNRRRVEAV